MKNYTIVKDGGGYVVQAGEKSVLKVASRRRAAKLVIDASGLLDQRAVEDPPPKDAASPPRDEPSIVPDGTDGS